MGYAQTRFGGTLLYTKLKGRARAGGVSSVFGPQPAPSGGGGSNESVIWPQEPADTDNIDGTQTYNMGINFEVTETVNAVGVRWRVPDVLTSAPSGGDYVASIWNDATQTRLAFKIFTPIAGNYQDIIFDAPLSISAGTVYIAAMYTRHYVFRTATSSVISPSGKLVVQGGRLVAYNGGANEYPSGTYDSWYYVAPIIQV